MSLDKQTIVSHESPNKTSPFPSNVALSEQPQLAKTRPLYCKNGLQPPSNSQPPLVGPPTPAQRIGKRRYSMGVSFKGPAKRRRRTNSDSQSEPVRPSHFLLGGNIFDPLNLNSLLDEEVNRTTNQETPKCSPLPSRGGDPVEILFPRDITDPLNLKGGGGEGEVGGGVLLSPVKFRRRHRNRHHGGGVGGGGGGGEGEVKPARLFPSTAALTVPPLTTEGSVSASPLPCELNTAITCRDDVAPPPILPRRHTHPPPGHTHKPGNQGDGRQRRRRRTTSTRLATNTVSMTTATQTTQFHTPLVGGAKPGRCRGPHPGSSRQPEKKKDQHRYQHGNHSRFYGYNGFYGDRFSPVHILGVELDKRLVCAAKQNIRHFLSHDLVVEERRRREDVKREEFDQAFSLLPFPLSFRVSRGPLSAPPLLPHPSSASTRFPSNITIVQGDYMSQSEAWPGRGQYDVIMCLGLTKWVQLQSGDGGVVRLFKRAYQSLSLGGLFILEPQPWSSYSHSKRASEATYRHYRSVRLRPEHFTSYLTDTVGFSSYRLLTHSGSQRPIYLFHKGPAQRK
ncbi:unnamed protein product [Pleuronectes platessa]|uniref:RNA methyltransferase n=1 Tax=Pleuronectes platessa TaxID=8262 RepID=A0A9N7U2T2_PLEPL|nr:unnamed protein product [Pleuronectes platessa]